MDILNNKEIYLDSNATAKYDSLSDDIVDEIENAMKTLWKNPSSLYSTHIGEIIENCRKNIADLIDVKPEEIYFTSGSSESNNWAIQGFVNEYINKGYQVSVITTVIEHKSILECVDNLNCDVHFVGVEKDGCIKYRQLESILQNIPRENKILVSVQSANNEIGTIQPIKSIAELVHKYNGIFHVDATQTFGHHLTNANHLDIDMMSASGHKVSPVLRGIGFLYKKDSVKIKPLIYGSQENKMRGGTENTYAIIGFNKAIESIKASMKTGRFFSDMSEIYKKRDYFVSQLQSRFQCKLNGDECAFRLPNNINVTFPDVSAESLLYMLNLSNIYVSTGSACNSHSSVPSYVLKAINLTDEEAMRTIRFSLSYDTTYEDIDNVLNEIDKCIKIIHSNEEVI